MAAIRTSAGTGRYVAGENDIVVTTAAGWVGDLPPLIYCHGAGENAAIVWADSDERQLLMALGQDFCVGMADLGGQLFGNDPHRTRIGQHKTYLNGGRWNATGSVVLVGSSMGAIGALGYTLVNPANVLGVACIIPALDIQDVYEATTPAGTVPPLIDAAYGGAYNDAVHGPDYSPVQFAAELDPDIPVHLFAADNDTAARPATVNAFLAARPQTAITWVGNLEHTDAAIMAAMPSVLEFVSQFA